MRKLLIALGGVVLIVGVAIGYLVATTPKTAPPLRFPLPAEQQQFVGRVPDTADSFAFIPAAAVVHAKLANNPVTSEPLVRWQEKQPLPPPWMIGGADVLLWRTGKSTSYAIRFDGLRAKLIRIWTTIVGPHDATWDGDVMLIGGNMSSPSTLDLTLANGLPEGDALLVQRKEARGAFPPIGRPAFTSVQITSADITIVSRAASSALTPLPSARTASFPKGAMLSAAFSEPPRILGDLQRLLGADIADLLRNGGIIALYDVDAGLLLPRPEGVIAIPADERGRAAMEGYRKYIEIAGEAKESGGELLISFDRKSAGLYINDEKVPASWPANRWSGRINPVTFVPVLRRLGDNHGLRFAAPRIHRSARDLRNWVDALERARSIEAAESASNGVEELRVRIVTQ